MGALLFVSAARGQETAEDRVARPVTLEWALPPDPCLDAATFHDGVRQALGREPFAPQEKTDRALRVTRETSAGPLVQVRLSLRERGEEVGSRVVDLGLDGCARARETVTLVAAMLLDVPKEEPPPPPPGPIDQPEAREPPLPPPPPPSAVQWDASALLTLSFGRLPGTAIGGAAEVMLNVDHRTLALASVGYAASPQVVSTDGTVDFRAVELVLGGAPLVLRPTPSLTALATAALHLTGLFATASGFDVAHDEVRWIPSAALGGQLRVQPFVVPLIFSLHTSVFIPFARPRFTILSNDTEVALHRPSAVGAALAAGVGVEFR